MNDESPGNEIIKTRFSQQEAKVYFEPKKPVKLMDKKEVFALTNL